MPEVKIEKIFMERLKKGEDLLSALSRAASSHGMRLGKVEAIGAVTGATLGFYRQEDKSYETVRLEGGLEIISLIGNISLKEGKPFLHAHVAFGDESGRAFGGHLMEGSEIFACEAVFTVFSGPDLVRLPDEATGLWLWRG